MLCLRPYTRAFLCFCIEYWPKQVTYKNNFLLHEEGCLEKCNIFMLKTDKIEDDVRCHITGQ